MVAKGEMDLGQISWRLIYDSEAPTDKAYFNTAYKNAGSGILVRECEGQDCAIPRIYYQRITDVATWEPWEDMFISWKSNKNTLNKDFKLFSSLEDLVMEKNAWTFCNYDEGSHGLGFPADCGPTGLTPFNWQSETHPRGVKDFEWSVL